ncbi:MAG TPA: sulfite exporter TauE/SafE family protein [Caulobacteraceae bacterium]|nr:sulfite exporter TauE/SafE family protein [Caulobacteraceae bacterium]
MDLLHGLVAHPLYILSGLVVGILVGLTGVGGGSLMTPLLILLFGIHPATAVGTDLLYAAATKTVGTSIHGFARSIEWKIVGLLALGSLPATVIVILALQHFGAASHATTKLISLTLAIALLISATLLFLKKWLVDLATRRSPDFGLRTSAGLTILTGFVVGALVALSSVGAGALGAVALAFLYPRLATLKIVGTDVAHAVPLTLLAGLGHWWLGDINFGLLGTLLLGSIPGVILGSIAARFSPEAALRTALGVMLAIVGVKMLTG